MIPNNVWSRFIKKVQKTDTCWLWTGCIIPGPVGGYGHFGFNGTQVNAHRVSYMRFKGDIPKGLEIDHLCRVRSCVNPDHLEAVSRRVNVLRGISPSAIHARKTKCMKGHDYSGANLYQWGTWRFCKKCRHDRYLKRRERANVG